MIKVQLDWVERSLWQKQLRDVSWVFWAPMQFEWELDSSRFLNSPGTLGIELKSELGEVMPVLVLLLSSWAIWDKLFNPFEFEVLT